MAWGLGSGFRVEDLGFRMQDVGAGCIGFRGVRFRFGV